MQGAAVPGHGRGMTIETPDEDINSAVELALGALRDGEFPKAGVPVPTVCGRGSHYPDWVHPYDNYWINRVSSYLFPRESTEWPIRLFAAYQTPLGEILGGVYGIPEEGWWEAWVDAGGQKGWQGNLARPLADHLASVAAEPDKIQYGIYVRDHLFVLQVYDQWRAWGHLPFLIEMYGHCRRSLKYLEQSRDSDGNGLIETTAILSDVVVAGDTDIHSTERAEDQVMLYGALLAFAEMADFLGGAADAAWARAWAERVKSTLLEHLWSPEGRFIYGMDTSTKRPRLGYTTATYANGYAILFGLTDPTQTEAILSFMARQSFAVPGPYYMPPIRPEDGPRHAPGVYVNGGCGWGRGIMPSVTLACFAHGRRDQGADYLRRQAAAARAAGSFYEYWTWDTYTGKVEPGGAPWYGETSAGFLDALLHGLFGLSAAGPGYQTVLLEPRLPQSWDRARLELKLPRGTKLGFGYEATEHQVSFGVYASDNVEVELSVPWPGGKPSRIEGDNLLRAELKDEANGYRITTHVRGSGCLRVAK